MYATRSAGNVWTRQLLEKKQSVWHFGPGENTVYARDADNKYVYAPYDRAAENREPRYIRFEALDVQDYFIDASRANGHRYVSLSCMIRLGQRDGDLPSLLAKTQTKNPPTNNGIEEEIIANNNASMSNFMNFINRNNTPNSYLEEEKNDLDEENNHLEQEDNPPQQDSDPDWVNEEDNFFEEGLAGWEMLVDDHQTTIPTRGEDGRVYLHRISVQPLTTGRSNNWNKFIGLLFGTGSKKPYKPVRHLQFPLRHPLLIKPLPTHVEMIEHRFGNLRTFFCNMIIEVNREAIENGPPVCTLEYYEEQRAANFIPISKDPFDLYETLIHQQDWDNYMSSLQPNVNTSSVRKFMPVAADTHAVMDNLIDTIGKRDVKMQGSLTVAERTALKLKNKPAQRRSIELEGQNFDGREWSKTQRTKRLLSVGGLNKSYHFESGTAWIDVLLDTRKMSAASSKRGGEQSQGAVMANTSATRIAGLLEWETTRIATGFYSSEWLHLSAFSWGGYSDPGARLGHSTSQNLENLVFGTSETNSLMTRYEMAWQAFFKAEQEIAEALTKKFGWRTPRIQGDLLITCNDFSRPIQYDFHGREHYSMEILEVPPEIIQEIKIIKDPMCLPILRGEGSDIRGVVDQGLNMSTDLCDMLAIAHDFPYIVYSIQYEVETHFKSWILGIDKPKNKFEFYPFRRPLYHSAEAALDAVLWKKLKEMGMAMMLQEEEAAFEEKKRHQDVVAERKKKRNETLRQETPVFKECEKRHQEEKRGPFRIIRDSPYVPDQDGVGARAFF